MLLVHEQCHVVQRSHPALFAELYVGAWGFVRMPAEPASVGALLRHQLVNPDGVDCVWALPVTLDGAAKLIQPQVIYGSDRPVPRMPGDFRTVALTVEKRGDVYAYRAGADGEPESRPLDSVRAYAARFAPSQENFHPNEICAELFSREVMVEALGLQVPRTPCQLKLHAWASKAFAAAAPSAK